MKRIPEDNSGNETQRPESTAGSNELDGLVELGMKREALRKARCALISLSPNAHDFRQAVQAVLTLADKLSEWSSFVEVAYMRLPDGDQPLVRFWMLSFHYSNRNFEAASRFIPEQFDSEHRLTEMVFAMDTTLQLGRMDQAGKLAGQLVRLVHGDVNPLDEAMLAHCLAEYLARLKDWDGAIGFLEMARFEPTFSQNAIIGIVEIHAARALRTLQQGFQLIERFDKDHDPASEIMIPGENSGIQRDAEKKFRRLQKILERIVPKERQKELGVGE